MQQSRSLILASFCALGLATAGTGDVLAGLVAGLLAQHVRSFDAASAAVYLHTAAAELVSAEIGHAGLLASDLLPKIPRAMMRLDDRSYGAL